MVGSQTTNLTPGPSFAHNLRYRCPNLQCEGILDIYAWRPFQWHQEHPNARCFAPCYRALNIRESQKTPNLRLFQVLGFTPTLGQSGVATSNSYRLSYLPISTPSRHTSHHHNQLIASHQFLTCKYGWPSRSGWLWTCIDFHNNFGPTWHLIIFPFSFILLLCTFP